jgi:glucosyl-3-phosphoglycerate synthase
LQTAAEPLSQGGGRVSELLMRPLFSLFYPQLCEFHQPLAGEYAVRRSLLERLSFPCGYAVETAHLIDVLALCGIEGFAQCDLDSRQHRNRPLDELGAMACSILQTFLQRAERDGLLRLPEALGKSYIRTVATAQGWSLEELPLAMAERPPFASLHETAHSL